MSIIVVHGLSAERVLHVETNEALVQIMAICEVADLPTGLLRYLGNMIGHLS